MKPADTLWPHQAEALAVTEEVHKEKRSRALLQFPPGGGKTETAARIALRWLARPFSQVRIVVPSLAILKQFHRRLGAETKLPIAIDQAERRAPKNARIVLATVNSSWDRVTAADRGALLINDEGHHANEDAACNFKLARSFDHTVLLTATPWPPGVLKYFGRPTVFLGLDDAVKQSIVAPYAVLDWEEPTGPFGLVFCEDNAQARAWSRKPAGSSWVTYDLGQDVVQARIAAWHAGKIPVLYANFIPREGVDETRCDRVHIAKLSKSDVLVAQMAGRALRFRPGKLAKIHCRSEEIRRRVERALARCNHPGGEVG